MTCATCEFHKPYGPDTMPGPIGLGICRRFPPSPLKSGTSWPVVRASDWCGEFRRVGPIKESVTQG